MMLPLVLFELCGFDGVELVSDVGFVSGFDSFSGVVVVLSEELFVKGGRSDSFWSTGGLELTLQAVSESTNIRHNMADISLLNN